MSGQANQSLPEGFQIDEYRILRVLASGGFSFVYLAHDRNEIPVALKEYLPAGLALRVDGAAAPSVAEGDLAAFRFGMKCFFEEGRALAGLNHPNVVRVFNFFRANETVYMAMRYERGRTLQEHIEARHGPLRENWVRRTFAQLLNGLREVHSNRLLHLDIKPSNIYVRNDGAPLLIDFGAARQTLGATAGRALPMMYTPGYASPEHHRNRELLGPWSDVYSVGASLYAALAEVVPPPADQRMERDRMISASKACSGKFSRQLLEIVDWCLRLDHLERPQSVFALQKTLLDEEAPVVKAAPPVFGQLAGALRRLTGR